MSPIGIPPSWDTSKNDLQQAKLYAAKAVEYVDKNFKHYLSNQDCRNTISVITKLAFDNPGIGMWPGNLVAQLIIGSCAHGTLDLQPSYSHKVIEASNALRTITNPMHMLGISDPSELDMFIHVVGREQFVFQHTATKQEIGRFKWVYGKLLSQESRDLLRCKIGVDPVDLVDCAFAFCAIFTNHSREAYRKDIDNALAKMGINFLTTDVLLLSLSTTPSWLRHYYHNRLEELEDKTFFWSEAPVLASKPIICLDQSHLICPFPNIVTLALYRFLGNKVRSDDRLLSDFSVAFQRYTELVLDDLEPNSIRYPDLEKCDGQRCDFLHTFDDGEIYVESKATRFAHKNLFPKAFEKDTSSGQIANGVVQISSSKTGLDKNPVGIIVIDDRIYSTHTDWYWERLCERDSRARDALNHFSGPIYIWNHHDLELAVSLSNATGKSVKTLLQEYGSHDPRHRGDWPQWVSNHYMENQKVSMKQIRWISNAAWI